MGKKDKNALLQKSPAEFFADNKNIAGFDNPGKSLYTTVRELVENSLDSAEGIGQLPSIKLSIAEVSLAQLNELRGISNTERLDEELYKDKSQRKTKVTQESQEAKDSKRVKEEEDAKEGKEGKKTTNATKATLYYKVTVEDNGSGMPHDQIPDMLGRALSGTKYGVSQTRGKYGLGAKMALIWSKMTTGMPFEIHSAQQGSSCCSKYTLDIDIQRNEPNVHVQEKIKNTTGWHGTRLSVTIQGAWASHRMYVLRYLRQIAVITPYAHISFDFKAVDSKHDLSMMFRRRTSTMPDPPKHVKHHPSSVDLELVKRLLADTKCKNLKDFLRVEFSTISGDVAGRLIQELQTSATAATAPQKLTAGDAAKLHNLLRSAHFAKPDGSHLSPAGEYNLRLGVIKELHPDLIATHQGWHDGFTLMACCTELSEPQECNFGCTAVPRYVQDICRDAQAAISLGGNMKPGINVHRFANRIPLLFEGGSDVITRTAASRISWSNYRINHNADKIGVFVSMVSTKIPFKGAGKEYIGDDIEQMAAAVKNSLQHCCLQLKSKLVKRQAAQQERERKRTLAKHIPNAAAAFMEVLKGMKQTQPGPKRRRLQLERNLDAEVAAGSLTREVLERKLLEHVESVDASMMLEYNMKRGLRSKGASNFHICPQFCEHIAFHHKDALHGVRLVPCVRLLCSVLYALPRLMIPEQQLMKRATRFI